MARTMFLCPLCLEHGRAVTLVVELEGADDAPARAIVASVQGGCAHSRRFGKLGGQTLMEMWRVIEAALEAGDSSPSRPAQEPRDGPER